MAEYTWGWLLDEIKYLEIDLSDSRAHVADTYQEWQDSLRDLNLFKSRSNNLPDETTQDEININKYRVIPLHKKYMESLDQLREIEDLVRKYRQVKECLELSQPYLTFETPIPENCLD